MISRAQELSTYDVQFMIKVATQEAQGNVCGRAFFISFWLLVFNSVSSTSPLYKATRDKD